MKKIIALFILSLMLVSCNSIAEESSLTSYDDAESTQSVAESQDASVNEVSEDKSDPGESLDSETGEEGSESEENSDAEQSENEIYECKLIVNGKDVTEGSGVKMYSDRAELPFVLIMEELGAEFFWDSDTVAQVHYNMVSPFKLDIETGILTSYYGDSDGNYFTEYGDDTCAYTALDKEILVEADNFKAFIFGLDYLFSVEYFDIDYEAKVVNIGRDLKDYECTLIVNGRDITEDSHAVMKRDDGVYFLLPLVAIMEELGAEFEWESDTVASFEFRGKSYSLDVTRCELSGSEWNDYLGPVPGGSRKYKAMEKELLVDDLTVREFFDSVDVTYEYDFDNRIVTIAEK